MGLKEAKNYINDLRKKQDNPEMWPDYLTGLPDKNAILKKVFDVYDRLGDYSIHFIRIANIQPYIIKYGHEKHADIIQWCAAILKTTADKHKGFTGAFGTHEFVVVCPTVVSNSLIKEATKLFSGKLPSFYNENDLAKGNLFSFVSNGKKVDVGLMRLVCSCLNTKTALPKDRVLPHLESECRKLE